MNDTERCPLPFLYKYYSPAGLKATLQNHACLWSHPARFNDPFDSQFKRQWHESLDEFLKGRADIPKALRKSTSFQKLMLKDYEASLNQKTFMWELYFGQKLNNTAMFCLTEDNANLLMWAHYAQNHTGGVIQFANLPKLANCQLKDAKQVRYTKNIPVFKFAEFFNISENAEKKREMADLLWDAYTLTKSYEWRYEKEWRLTLELEEPAPTVLVDFESAEVTAVHLGCRMSPKNREEITAIVKAEYSHAEIYVAATQSKKFALEFEPVA